MLFLAVLLTMISAKSAQLSKNSTEIVICNGLIYNDTFYKKIVLYQESGRFLFMHDPSGDLFFSHHVRNETTISSRVAACHVETKACRDINGINGGFTIGYDRRNDKIYFGGIDGIYIYNNKTDAAEFYAEEGNSVWGIFVLNNFYYIEYPSQHLYVKRGNVFVPSNIKTEVLTFYANENTIYYSNRSGLFTLKKKPQSGPVALNKHIVVRQITEDIYGNIYFCASDGIYMEDRHNHAVKKLATVVEAFGITFMKQYIDDSLSLQLIYSDDDKIYRLLPTKHSQICYEAVITADEKLSKSTLSGVHVDVKFDFE